MSQGYDHTAWIMAQPVIGVDTLETLGLKVDPTTGRLEKTEYHMPYI